MTAPRKVQIIDSPMNIQQQTYMNAFDLYIETVKLEYRGYFQIKWRRGRKTIQTLKYQSQGKTITIKETLTLNITLTTKNNRIAEKCTVLDVLGAHQELIDSISLPVHRWTPEFTSLELATSKGLIKAKARRRQLMQLNVPALMGSRSQSITNSDDEYSQLLEQSLNAKIMMSETKNARSPIDSHRDEVTKLRKQLEDSLYVNNKLKNDRSILMSRNIELESQISFFKTQVKEEFNQLEKYYVNKMEAHQAIYQEEINNMITIFNTNSESSGAILKNVMQENKKIEGELREIKVSHASACQQMEEHSQKLLEIELEKEELRRNLQQYIQEIDLLRATANKEKLQLQTQNSRLLKSLTQSNQQKLSLKRIIQTLQADKLKITNEKFFVQRQLQDAKKQINEQVKRLQELQGEFEESRNELQFTEQAYKKQKQSSQSNQQALRNHIIKLEQIISQFQSKQLTFRNEKVGKEEYFTQQNDSLKKQIMRLRGQVERMTEQTSQTKKRFEEQEQQHLSRIQSLSNEVQLEKKNREAKLKQIELDQSKSVLQSEQVINQRNEQIQKQKKQISDSKSQIENLVKQIKQLKQSNQKLTEELHFINENAIKVEDHDQLQSRVVELEAKLAEYQLHYQNVDFPSFEKQLGESDKKQKAKQQAKNHLVQNISFEGQALHEKIKMLEKQLKDSSRQINQVVQENKELRQSLEQAIRQLKQLQSREQDLMKQLQIAKATEIKIVQYCESQEDISRKIEEMRQPTFAEDSFQNKQKSKVQAQVPSLNSIKSKKSINRLNSINSISSLNNKEKQLKLKKSVSGTENLTKKSKRHSEAALPSQGASVVYEHPHEISRKVERKKNVQKQRDEINANKKSVVSLKMSGFRGQTSEVKGQAISNKSDYSNDQQQQSRSRESFVSGTTLYQFKRVTHGQKIKLLEKEVQEYQQFVQESKIRQNELLLDIQRANQRVLQFEKQLKHMDEDRHSLKQTLHFELEKKNNQRQNRSSQTEEKEKQSKSTQANIIVQDSQKTNLQFQIAKQRKQNDEQVSKLEMKIQEHDKKTRYLQDKVEDSDKKLEQLLKRLQEKVEQVEKLKKEVRLAEQKDIEWKNLLHTTKLQKKQVEFFLEKHETENKKLKQTIQEQQEKIRKNDIADAYRQLEYELENTNKKVLEMNRQIYQAKLEKDTIDDEVKLLRKKNVELNKKYTELEYSIESYEKNIEEQKRKESRHRRQIESKQDANEKLRDQVKKLNEEISMLKNLSNQQLFTRKKYMDEIAGLQHSLERKQYELISLRKQLQRVKYMMQEKEEEKLEHKQSLRRQLQLLETELSQKNKQIFELQSSIKHLTNQQQFSTAQNKRNMNEKSGLYSEKLKVYIEEIAEIKKLLDQNNIETNNLKYQLKEYEDELLNLRVHTNKLEDKLKDETNGNKQLVGLLEDQHNKSENLKQKLQEISEEQYALRNLVKNTKAELQQERKENMQRKQQFEQAGKANEALKEQLSKNKIKISEYETQLQINRNYTDKLNQYDKELKNTTKELREVKNSFDDYRRKYIHTANELETTLRNSQNKWRQKYELMQESLQQEMEANANKNKKQLQSQVLQLLSEVSNARTQSQKKSQLISQLEFKITKMEILPLRVAEIQKLYNQKLEENKRLKVLEGVNKQLREKSEKAESNANKTSQYQEKLSQKLQQAEEKISSTQAALERITEGYNIVQRENISLTNEVTNLRQQEGALKSEIHNLLSSVRSLQDEKVTILRKSEEQRKEHNDKISRLESRLEQMSNTVQEHEQALSTHYERNLEQIKSELDKMAEQLQEKEKSIAQNYELMAKIQYDLQSERKEVARLKDKEATEAQYFEMEYNKLKNKMLDRQKQQNQQIHQLEMEVEEMSKQLTHTKLQSLNNIQLPKQESIPAVTMMRLQDKLKQKDLKIEELKRSTYTLEETIVKLKKKEVTMVEHSERNTILQKENSEYLNEIRRLEDQLRKISANQFNSSQALRLEINSLKAANEKLKITLQQKQMEHELAGFELATLKELYGELKKQLEKRNANLKQKADKQFQEAAQADRISEKINQLEYDLRQKVEKQKRIVEQLAKKDQIIIHLEERLSEYEKTTTKLKSISKLNTDGQHYKNEIKRLGEENETLQKINKKLREEISILEKDNYEAKTKLSFNQSSIDNLNTTVEEMSIKMRELEHNNKRYQDLNESCFKIFRLSLDEAIFHGYLSRRIDEKEMEINNLLQEVEQLKFLNERKLLDYDELRKQNYQLQLRLEDAEFAEEQVDELRQICDKLEQEKKDAIYRQEVLKVQLERILDSGSTDVRQRLQKMKLEQMMKKLTNNSHNRVTFS